MKNIISKLLAVLILSCSIFCTVTSIDDDNFPTTLSSSNDTLVFAHVIFRHGDRNIEYGSYPNDPYRNESLFWPEGFGELTKKGKRQEFNLGKYFRRRYNKLLGEKYSPKKIFIQSTDVDRTLMSAQMVLAGLFIPNQDDKWNDHILWQPIPVHTLPRKLDNVVAAQKPCPKYMVLLANHLRESKRIQEIYTKYADLFPYLSRMSGSNIKTIYDVFQLYDVFVIEREQDKTLPKWADETTLKQMEYIAQVAHSTYAGTSGLARLKCGYLLKEMLEHYKQKINSTLSPDRSVWLYSGHDQTILNMLNTLRIYDLRLPPYSSSLHLELYKSTQGEHFVQLFYRSSEEEHPEPMEIPKCGTKCPLNQFHSLYSDVIPGEFEEECRLP